MTNLSLIQMGEACDVVFNGYTHGGRDASADYVGTVNFSLFGLPGEGYE